MTIAQCTCEPWATYEGKPIHHAHCAIIRAAVAVETARLADLLLEPDHDEKTEPSTWDDDADSRPV